MNRKERRELAKMKPKEFEAYIESISLEKETKAFYRGQAKMIYLALAFLHIDKGHTGKYLRKWLAELDNFVLSVNGYGPGSMEELNRILIEECGFDMLKEYGDLIKGGKNGQYGSNQKTCSA